jgi:hypothetical protein
MKFIFHYWRMMLLPHKFYGGGGGGTNTVEQNNPEERALAEISDQKWEEYKKTYMPLENEWMGKVQRLDDPIYHNKAASLVSNELKAKQGVTTPGMTDAMMGQRFAGGNNYIDTAQAISKARVNADHGVTDRYLKGVQGVVAMGQGQSADAIGGLTDVAETSMRAQMNDDTNRFRADQAEKGTVGTVAGAGMAAAAHSDLFKGRR